MLYKQILHSCFKEENANHLLTKQDFVDTKQQIKVTQKLLRQDIADGKIGCLQLDEDLSLIKEVAAEIKEKFRTLIIIGIGGSSLGGQTLCGTRFYQYFQNQGPNIIFLDNIHYLDFTSHLAPLNLEQTGVLMISKSGTTLETITLATYIANYFHKKKDDISNNFYCITENTDNPLRNLARKINARILDHPKNIGGRYSCFSLVSLIPAAICQFDIEGFLQGAKDTLDDFCNNDENFVVDGAALLRTAERFNINEAVFIPYIQKLSYLPSWYVQLFAESLGKEGKGIMPIKAMGSVDQHSVFQLFLDGPSNKSFTIITENIKNSGNDIVDDICDFENIEYLKNHTLGDIIQAQQEAVIYALKSCYKPVREIHCAAFSDRALGQIMMHFVLEVILLGYAANINPFDQPAVEIGKAKTRKILSNL